MIAQIDGMNLPAVAEPPGQAAQILKRSEQPMEQEERFTFSLNLAM